MAFQFSRRLQELPPYIFAEIDRLKMEAKKKGKDLLSLGIGDPDRPTPAMIVEKLQLAAAKSENHGYSPYNGTYDFRSSVVQWCQKRFGLSLDAEKEVIALIGSKEGIAHFPVAFCNPGDVCLFPSPGYPAYLPSIRLAGAEALPYPLILENGFIPDLNELEFNFLKLKPKVLILNYPSNPTSVMCDREVLKDLVFLARKYGVILAYDNAYSEIYFDVGKKPVSILEIEGAKDVAIEFHSFSKTFNMAGWRLAFAVGNEELIAGLLKTKTNMDSGPLLAVQEAAVFALHNADVFSDSVRKVYAERQKIMVQGLEELGLNFVSPQATFFVWARVPGKEKSMDFVRRLIEEQGLVVTPGIGFGEHGEGFFRMAMTLEKEKIQEALIRLGAQLKKTSGTH